MNMGKRAGAWTLKFWQKSIKRQIPIEKITAVTYSSISNQFVLHVPSEYDYYLGSDFKDEFLEYLIVLLKEKGQTLDFYEVEDVDLAKYTKNEGSKKQKYPEVTPKVFSQEQFLEY